MPAVPRARFADEHRISGGKGEARSQSVRHDEEVISSRRRSLIQFFRASEPLDEVGWLLYLEIRTSAGHHLLGRWTRVKSGSSTTQRAPWRLVVSLRREILGWVIQRLNAVDDADREQRAALFQSLRQEVAEGGFCGSPPDKALPHLESAIVRQEMHWLRDAPRAVAFDGSLTGSAPKVEVRPSPRWSWPSNLVVPSAPPGPSPGPASGPFSDRCYESLEMRTPDGPAELRIGWNFDPACVLSARCAAIGFLFQTRAATFADAAEHLRRVLQVGGLVLPDAVMRLDA